MAAIGRPPQDDELSHPYAETSYIGDHAAMGDQDQRQPIAMRGDLLLDLGDLAPATFHVVERALQDIPRLRLPEGQAGRVQAAAARARQYRADRDPVLPKRVADPLSLRAATFVEVALGRAVVEPGARRIEAARGKAVTQDHNGTGRT